MSWLLVILLAHHHLGASRNILTWGFMDMNLCKDKQDGFSFFFFFLKLFFWTPSVYIFSLTLCPAASMYFCSLYYLRNIIVDSYLFWFKVFWGHNVFFFFLLLEEKTIKRLTFFLHILLLCPFLSISFTWVKTHLDIKNQIEAAGTLHHLKMNQALSQCSTTIVMSVCASLCNNLWRAADELLDRVDQYV